MAKNVIQIKSVGIDNYHGEYQIINSLKFKDGFSEGCWFKLFLIGQINDKHFTLSRETFYKWVVEH